MPFTMSSSDVLLSPCCDATLPRELSAASVWESVTEMPFAAAVSSMMANLISQDSTTAGICAVVIGIVLA